MIETFIIFIESFNRKREMEYIERKLYLDKIRPFVGKSLVKVLVGQRRAGKSYLLFQIMDLIKSNEPEKQIIYINKDQE